MSKYYSEMIDGVLKHSVYPFNKDEAIAEDSGRYSVAVQCPQCGNGAPNALYVDGDGCVECFQRQTSADYVEMENAGAIQFPRNPHESAHWGGDHYWTGRVCKGGPHAVKHSAKDGECMTCREDTVAERIKRASAAGEDSYMPKKACKVCDELHPRRICDRKCRGCLESSRYKRTETPSTALMNTFPDLILAREDAIAAGFKVFRTGRECRRGHAAFRYTATSGCIACAKRV